MAKRLKQQYLRLADNQELLQGVQGEIITADVLKPYIDALATKTNAQDIQTAVTALENKILGGGVDMDGDTLSELYAKITTLKNLTDADKTGLVALISAKADEASVAFRLGAKADETSVQNRLDAKADEASVVTRLGAKADEASVVTRLGAKADEASVATRLADKASIEQLLIVETIAQNAVTDELLGLALANKITAAQAEVIAQTITNALETKIMGGVGTDADTFAELKGLLSNLQNLSEADVNGLVTLVSQKVAKSDIYNTVANPKGEDFTQTGVLIANFISDFDISMDKVLSAKLFNTLMQDLLATMGQAWQQQGVMNDGFGQSIATKLDKVEFQGIYESDENFKGLTNLNRVQSQKIETSGIHFNDGMLYANDYVPNFLSYEFGPNGNSSNIVLSNDETNAMLVSILEFAQYLASNEFSPVSQRIKTLEDRVLELEGMFENV